ncbi:MAG: hypothetical protein ACTSRP_07385 [Candidatus Helarchaeota archaeon]
MINDKFNNNSNYFDNSNNIFLNQDEGNISYLNIRSYEFKDVPEELFYIYLGIDEQLVLFDFRNYSHRLNWNPIGSINYTFKIDSLLLESNNSGIYSNFEHLGDGFTLIAQNLTLVFTIKQVNFSKLVIILNPQNYDADYLLDLSNYTNQVIEVHIPIYMFQKFENWDGTFNSIGFYSLNYSFLYLSNIKVANWHNSYYIIKNETELQLNSSTIHLGSGDNIAVQKQKNLTIQAEAQTYNDSNNILINSTGDFQNYADSYNCSISNSLELNTTGYKEHHGLFTFKNDTIGSDPTGFTVIEPASSNVEVVYSSGRHLSCTKIEDNNNAAEVGLEDNINNVNGGRKTIELLFNISENSAKGFFVQVYDGGTTLARMSFWEYNNTHFEIQYKASFNYYHARYYEYNKFLYVNMTLDFTNNNIDYNFSGVCIYNKAPVSSLTKITKIIYKTGSLAILSLYIDSIDYSWSTGYEKQRILQYDSQYYNRCIYETKVIQTNNSILTQVNFSKQVNENTSCLVSYAISEDNETFSDYSEYYSDNFTISENHSYLKLRVLLNTSNNLQTPILNFINISYNFTIIDYYYYYSIFDFNLTQNLSKELIYDVNINKSLKNTFNKIRVCGDYVNPHDAAKTYSDDPTSYHPVPLYNYSATLFYFKINDNYEKDYYYFRYKLENYLAVLNISVRIYNFNTSEYERIFDIEPESIIDSMYIINNTSGNYYSNENEYGNIILGFFVDVEPWTVNVYYANIQNMSFNVYNFVDDDFKLECTEENDLTKANNFNETYMRFELLINSTSYFEFNFSFIISIIINYKNYLDITFNVNLSEFEEITFNYKNNCTDTYLLVILKNDTSKYILANLSRTSGKISYYGEIDTRYDIYYYNITDLQRYYFTQLILHFEANNSFIQIQNFSCFIRFFAVNDMLNYRLESEENRQRYDILYFDYPIETLLIKDVFGRDIYREKVQYKKFIDVFISIAEVILVNDSNKTIYFEFYINLQTTIFYGVPPYTQRIVNILTGDYYVKIVSEELVILDLREIELTTANRTSITYKEEYIIRPPSIEEPWYHTGIELIDLFLDAIIYIFTEGFVPYGLIIILIIVVFMTYEITKYIVKQNQKKKEKIRNIKKKRLNELKKIRGY